MKNINEAIKEDEDLNNRNMVDNDRRNGEDMIHGTQGMQTRLLVR
jgi:hypothetical protein